jgi:hypothetical protein
MSTSLNPPAPQDAAVLQCADALRRLADYRLPAGLDRRLLQLSESKETLTAEEREELLALVEFAEDRTLERARAAAALVNLVEAFPVVVGSAT